MRGLRDYQKLNEAVMTSMSPQPARGMLGSASAPPVYTDANGNTITSVVCGGVIGFTVPGWEGKQIWLTEYKNGTKSYDGLFGVPMAPYTTICGQDEGTYQDIAYDPVSGVVLGQTTFQILPATGVPAGGGTPGGSLLGKFSTTELLIGAAAVYFLFLR